MESAIVRNLQPEFEPVAVVWSDTLPEETVQSSRASRRSPRPCRVCWASMVGR